MKFGKQLDRWLYGLPSLLVLNVFWFLEVNRTNGNRIVFLIVCNGLLIAAMVIAFLSRFGIILGKDTLIICRGLKSNRILLSEIIQLEWDDVLKKIHIRLRDGSQIRLDMSRLTERSFNELKAELKKKI